MATEHEALQALEEFGDQLTNLSNVVGLGIVHADLSNSGSKSSTAEDMAVAVYVEKILSKAEVVKDQLIPKILKLKRKGKKIEVQIQLIEQGEVSLEDSPGLERL